jgi:hypothetical protein
MKDYHGLDMAVLDLHNIARLVESDIGRGMLSEDIRNCADRLHALIKETYTLKENTSEESNA